MLGGHSHVFQSEAGCIRPPGTQRRLVKLTACFCLVYCLPLPSAYKWERSVLPPPPPPLILSRRGCPWCSCVALPSHIGYLVCREGTSLGDRPRASCSWRAGVKLCADTLSSALVDHAEVQCCGRDQESQGGETCLCV